MRRKAMTINMKPIVRISCALLASLMLLGTLASCAETREFIETLPDTDAVTSAGTVGETSDVIESETEAGPLKDDIPDGTTFDHKEVVILSRYREGWTAGEIAVEGLNTDLINDAVYERNQEVENRLKVKIVSVEEPNHDPAVTIGLVRTAVAAGTHEYDLLACACYETIPQSLEGTFMDLRSTDYLDLGKPWWAQGFNEAVEYKGSQFVATGSALLSMYRFAFVTVFNKAMFTDSNVPFLYEDVKNGTWTLDRQIELVQLFHRDDGNGKQDEDGDIYGLVSNDYISVDPYWSSCEVAILGRDETGAYELVFDSSKLFDVAEKVIKLFFESGNAVYNYKHYGLDDEQVDIRNMFAKGGAAMATLRILELENEAIRNMQTEYGVIPIPKFSKEQESYHTSVHDQVTVFAIPATIVQEEDSHEMVGALMEALASDSHYGLRTAYYETTLRTKLAQDPESAEMMDMIIDNIYIDAGILYVKTLNNFHDRFRQIIGKGVNSVTSDYRSVVTGVERRQLPKMLEKLDMLVD